MNTINKIFCVLMTAAVVLVSFTLANAMHNAMHSHQNSDTTITSIDTTCIRCEMSKSEFLKYLKKEGAIADPDKSELVANYFYVIDNSWYTISIDSWNAYLRNLESVARALEAKKKYGDLIELDDILDLD